MRGPGRPDWDGSADGVRDRDGGFLSHAYRRGIPVGEDAGRHRRRTVTRSQEAAAEGRVRGCQQTEGPERTVGPLTTESLLTGRQHGSRTVSMPARKHVGPAAAPRTPRRSVPSRRGARWNRAVISLARRRAVGSAVARSGLRGRVRTQGFGHRPPNCGTPGHRPPGARRQGRPGRCHGSRITTRSDSRTASPRTCTAWSGRPFGHHRHHGAPDAP